MNQVVGKILEEGSRRLWSTFVETFVANVAAQVGATAVAHIYQEMVGDGEEVVEELAEESVQIEYEDMMQALATLLEDKEHSAQVRKDLSDLLWQVEQGEAKPDTLLKKIEKIVKDLQ